jgi:hypothetical protein
MPSAALSLLLLPSSYFDFANVLRFVVATDYQQIANFASFTSNLFSKEATAILTLSSVPSLRAMRP